MKLKVGAGDEISALGTRCRMVGFDSDPSAEAKEIFARLIDEMDRVASRFRQDSEMRQKFNGEPRRDVVVSELLFDAMEAALRAAWITNGYLDPTVGSSMVSLGYERDFSALPAGEQSHSRSRVTLPAGYRKIRLNRSMKSVSVASGVVLDLGATGKAFLADRIRQQIESELLEKVLVNLGGDISASLVEGEGWPVRITDDRGLDPASKGLVIRISGGGVATSSTVKRSWKSGSESLHHIIDPHTGMSSRSSYDTVTVIAGSALDANVASSGTIAMGELGPEWLKSTGLPALARKLGEAPVHYGRWNEFVSAGGNR